jgi:hypothetical protein
MDTAAKVAAMAFLVNVMRVSPWVKKWLKT